MSPTRMHKPFLTTALTALIAVGGLGGVSAAQAANGATSAASQAQYDLEVQRCNSGKSGQDRAVCLQEAGAARDEANRNRLNDGQSANYGTNATDRCSNLPSAQRDDCLLQMRSPSSVQGSVQGGGVLRETVIPVPAPATPATPAAPSYTPQSTTPDMTPPNLIAPGSSATPLPVQR